MTESKTASRKAFQPSVRAPGRRIDPWLKEKFRYLTGFALERPITSAAFGSKNTQKLLSGIESRFEVRTDEAGRKRFDLHLNRAIDRTGDRILLDANEISLRELATSTITIARRALDSVQAIGSQADPEALGNLKEVIESELDALFEAFQAGADDIRINGVFERLLDQGLLDRLEQAAGLHDVAGYDSLEDEQRRAQVLTLRRSLEALSEIRDSDTGTWLPGSLGAVIAALRQPVESLPGAFRQLRDALMDGGFGDAELALVPLVVDQLETDVERFFVALEDELIRFADLFSAGSLQAVETILGASPDLLDGLHAAFGQGSALGNWLHEDDECCDSPRQRAHLEYERVERALSRLVEEYQGVATPLSVFRHTAPTRIPLGRSRWGVLSPSVPAPNPSSPVGPDDSRPKRQDDMRSFLEQAQSSLLDIRLWSHQDGLSSLVASTELAEAHLRALRRVIDDNPSSPYVCKMAQQARQVVVDALSTSPSRDARRDLPTKLLINQLDAICVASQELTCGGAPMEALTALPALLARVRSALEKAGCGRAEQRIFLVDAGTQKLDVWSFLQHIEIEVEQYLELEKARTPGWCGAIAAGVGRLGADLDAAYSKELDDQGWFGAKQLAAVEETRRAVGYAFQKLVGALELASRLDCSQCDPLAPKTRPTGGAQAHSAQAHSAQAHSAQAHSAQAHSAQAAPAPGKVQKLIKAQERRRKKAARRVSGAASTKKGRRKAP